MKTINYAFPTWCNQSVSMSSGNGSNVRRATWGGSTSRQVHSAAAFVVKKGDNYRNGRRPDSCSRNENASACIKKQQRDMATHVKEGGGNREQTEGEGVLHWL